MASLPIIDPASYLPDCQLPPEEIRADRAKSAREIHEACRDIGFFYLRVPPSLLTQDEMKDVLEVGREFFARPAEEKEAIGLDRSDGVRGYQKLHQNITLGKADHHEGLDLYAPDPYPTSLELRGGESAKPTSNGSSSGKKLRPLEGPNLLPSHPARSQAVLEKWTEKMKVLGMAVMRCMADGLGMDEREWEGLRGMVDDSFWVMRVIGYPPLPDGQDGISCGEHKDYGCLTLLHADPIAGSLQVLPRGAQSKSQSEPEWIHADPIPGCLVVNIGSMWEIWSGGMYPATLHRVVHKSPVYRVSVPFFFEPNFDARVRLLAAAKRKAASEGSVVSAEDKEVVYGRFLLDKVGGNFKY